nr:ferric reductase-like transmembrane domain-containing protein [Sphingomicrobium sediminis]
MAVRLALAEDPWLADWIAETGEWSARFIILALILTPLQKLFGNRPWVAFLIRHRRAIGVAAFLYALAHLGFYLVDMGALSYVIDEALVPSILTAWLALLAMLPPALSSSDAAMRALGKGWKRLQRFAYPAAILTLIHWLLVHDGMTEALVHFVPLAALQLARLAQPFFKRRNFA